MEQEAIKIKESLDPINLQKITNKLAKLPEHTKFIKFCREIGAVDSESEFFEMRSVQWEPIGFGNPEL